MNVWSYWNGPQPDWITVCLDSIRHSCVNSTFRLLTEETASEFVPEIVLDHRWRTLEPGIGTDCLRAALIATHGGLWIDADTICLKDPAILSERHDRRQALYSTWPAVPDRCIAGYFYAPSGHRVAREWLAEINAALIYSENIGWMDLGEKMLTPIIRRSPSATATWKMSRETFLPINVSDEPHRLFVESGWRDYVTPDTIAFGLNHSWMMKHRSAEMNAEPNTSMLIHRLLRDAKNAIETGKNILD